MPRLDALYPVHSIIPAATSLHTVTRPPYLAPNKSTGSTWNSGKHRLLKLLRKTMSLDSCSTARSIWGLLWESRSTAWENHLCRRYHGVCNRKHSLRSTEHVFFSQLEASLIPHLRPAQLQTHITSTKKSNLIKSYLWVTESLKKAKPKIIAPRWQRPLFQLRLLHEVSSYVSKA